jgi:hypothetical protein
MGPGTSASPSTGAAPASGSRPPTVAIFSFAFFEEQRPRQCHGFSVKLTAELGAGELEELEETLRRRVAGGKAESIQELCIEPFGEQLVEGICVLFHDVVQIRGHAEPLFHVATFYGPETSERSDTLMQQCIDAKGEWHKGRPDAKPASKADVLESMRAEAMRLSRRPDEPAP